MDICYILFEKIITCYVASPFIKRLASMDVIAELFIATDGTALNVGLVLQNLAKV